MDNPLLYPERIARCQALVHRGLAKPVARDLFEGADRTMFARVEGLNAAEIRALNDAAVS